MADKGISDLTAATSLNASDLFEIENAGGNSRKMTAANAKVYFGFPNRTFTNTLSNASGTTVIPADNTIPQITEGTEVLTLSHTPSSTTARLRVQALVCVSYSIASQWVSGALFVGAAANAVYVAPPFWNISVNGGGFLMIDYEYVPGITSAQTIAVRAGPSAGGGTVTFNKLSNSASMGGLILSSMVVTEVA